MFKICLFCFSFDYKNDRSLTAEAIFKEKITIIRYYWMDNIEKKINQNVSFDVKDQ